MNDRVKRVRTALGDAGYRTAWHVPAKDGERDFSLTGYAGGRLGVVIVQEAPWGVEVFGPVDTTNRMDSLIAKLTEAPNAS